MITQANRLIAIDTPLGKDVLLLRGFRGQEAISRLFSFELDLLSTDPDIKFEDIIGKRTSIRVTLGIDKERYFNGFITRFMQTGSDTGLANYRATMVPWLWFLTRTADCRLFQNKSVPDIIQQIFKELGFTDVKMVLKKTYEPDDYCVQYRETDFNFVSRLMEQYGIFYFFEHEKDKHTLIIADDPSACQPCPEQPTAKWEPQGSAALAEDVIASIQCERTLRCGKYAVTDYNFETPNTSLLAETTTTIKVGGNGKYEIYDYPGEYFKKAEGERLAKIRMEEEEAQHFVVSGSSSCRGFCSGYRFDLNEYMRQDMNGAYVLTSVQHVASVGSTYTTGGTGGAGEEDYSNSFTCIPHKIPFRPPQITPKPMVQGPQTAVVVGPKGEEIYTDKYGRVKVQFHWDREGKKDEKSSCWIRVAQNWAGKQWGVVFNPRIGQEVIVEFLEGDPDQPIITGRVYNAEQMPPYNLPDNMTQSGVKTRSTLNGSHDNFNEIRFEDKKGQEQLFVHAERNQDIEVEKDETHWVGHDRQKKVDNDENTTIGRDRKENVGKNETISIGENRKETVGKNETISIGENRSESVGKNEDISIGKNRTENVGENENITIGKNRTEQVGKNEEVSVGENRTHMVAKNDQLDVGKQLLVTAGDVITFRTGSASLILKKNGDIQLKGSNILVDGAGKVNIKASSDVVLKGSKVTQN